MEYYSVFEKNKPLSERLRPTRLEEFVGQEHIVKKGSLLNRAIEAGILGSCIFYGPPGTGKTTLANIIAKTTNGKIEKLNAVSSGVAEAKAIIDRAKKDFELFNTRTYLFLDECHRWSKAQSDCVLQAIEEGFITFIGSTTENPYVNMTRAIVSRCRVFEFKPITSKDVKKVLIRAVNDKENGLGSLPVELEEDALEYFAYACSGDVRQALNGLELAVKTTKLNKNKKIVITKQIAVDSIGKPSISISEDLYYHLLSAFCKSLRGSDSTAALYYANRLIEAGVEPQVLARRTIAHASEDVGISAPQALLQACASLYALDNLGMPEGNLALTQAIIYVCESPKDNRVVVAMNKAQDDARNHPDDNVPDYLKNHTEASKKYKYPHDYGGYVSQQYLPDSLKDRKYFVRKEIKKETKK